ncbi:MAG TPA: hypothetical protein VMP08_12860 [Anaerolineae bacterium]|nr:hypothetical protein [Anaerolineae bacterium]
MTIPIPLPNPWNTSETVLIAILLLFFAAWGWRHGLDAAIIAGLIVIFGIWAAPQLAAPLGKIINAFYAFFILIVRGQFSMENWTAAINAQSQLMTAPVDVQNAESQSMQLFTILIFAAFAIIGFRYATKKAGGKDPFIASVFGLLGAAVVGYMCIRFILDRIFTFPQTVVIEESPIPAINIDAFLLIAVVLVLVVFGVQRSKPPTKKG